MFEISGGRRKTKSEILGGHGEKGSGQGVTRREGRWFRRGVPQRKKKKKGTPPPPRELTFFVERGWGGPRSPSFLSFPGPRVRSDISLEGGKG